MNDIPQRRPFRFWILIFVAICIVAAAVARSWDSAKRSAVHERQAQELQDLRTQIEELKRQIKPVDKATPKSP